MNIQTNNTLTIKYKEVYIFSIFLTLLIALYTMAIIYDRYLTDYLMDYNVYTSAAKQLLSDPYTNTLYYNPPWVLLFFVPFIGLPDSIGYAIWFVISLLGYLYLAIRFKSHPITIIAMFFSLPVMFGLVWGQLDWLILLGIFLPRPLGFLLLASKPQISICILLQWMYEEYKKKQLIRLILPTIICFLLSFYFYGLWFLYNPLNMGHDRSIWPYGIILGIFLLYKKKFLEASPFFSPFLSVQSWGNIMFNMKPKMAIAFSAFSWLFWGLLIR